MNPVVDDGPATGSAPLTKPQSRWIMPHTDAAEPEEMDGLADTPGSVLQIDEDLQWRPSIYERRCRRPPAAYPGTRAGSPQSCPVWPCSGWGLPSRSGHPVRWWSLTPPFHPYPVWTSHRGGLFSVALACGSPRVGVTHHPALRSPDVPREKLESASHAAAWPTHPHQFYVSGGG